MDAVTFRLNLREWDDTFRDYMQHTKRALPDVLNKKGLFIARGALRETPKADRGAIRSALGSAIRTKKGIRLHLTKSRDRSIPLAEAILRARIYRKGGIQPPAAEMQSDEAALITARQHSVAFLKSGWIPAIRTLDAIVNDKRGQPPADIGGAKIVGSEKGRAVPATAGLKVRCLIENHADASHDAKEALIKYGGPALQREFDSETSSMEQEIFRRQGEEAKACGIRVVSS